MTMGLLIAAIVIILIVGLKIFIKTVKVFLFLAVIAVFFIVWMLFRQGKFFL